MPSLCGRQPLIIIGGGEEPFQQRTAVVAETHVSDLESSWPERRMHFARSWRVRLADAMGLGKINSCAGLVDIPT